MPDNSIFPQRATVPSTPGIPLPERMRPNSLAEFVGQEHLVGPGAVLRKMIESGNISSFILWGPPGVGKTTLAHIVSRELHRDFYTLSAINSGVKDLRDVFARAKDNSIFAKGSPILFIDEIHRFSKSQQDALLGAVETGTVTLIGATTENPSFEVITPLLSRCQVFVMKSLEVKDLEQLLDRALTQDAYLSSRNIEVRERTALFRFSGGDARKLLNIFEIVTACRRTSPSTTRTERCTTTSSQPSSRAYAARTQTEPSTGWPGCWPEARIPCSLPGEWSYWPPRT